MNGHRAKKIRELVVNGDPFLLLTIRNYYEEKTEDMKPYQIYKAAKKLWSRNVSEIKTWGKGK